MRYTLMHKNIPVTELTIDGQTGYLTAADTLHCPERMPVGTLTAEDSPDMRTLQKWWQHRAIPRHRPKLEKALDRLHAQSPAALALHSNAVSLSDRHWIRPKDSDLAWEDVNFFDHPFSPDVGRALFGENIPGNKPDRNSPDNTTDGMLKKRWEVIDGARCLIKGGTGPYHQEPLNETVASEILRRLNIPHVDYTVDWRGNFPYSVCPNFLTPETEYIPAYYICKTQTFNLPGNLYRHYLDCCETLGIPGVKESLDYMMTVDNIIGNSDRHFGNFGAVRNADTLEWLGAAPLFDHGNSLWHDTATQFITAESGGRCKTFYRNHTEQRHLITAFDWLDFTALGNAEDVCTEVLATSPYMDEARIAAIRGALRNRIDNLRHYALRRDD
jgi:hypothetical protein